MRQKGAAADSDDDYSDNESSKKKNRVRMPPISIEGDFQVYPIMKSLGLYTHLRRTFIGIHAMSTKEASQTVRRCSSCVAYCITDDNSSYNETETITKSMVIGVLCALLRLDGHGLIYKYIEHLGKKGYTPSTLLHNVEYTRHMLTFAYRNIPECQRNDSNLTSLLAYLSELCSQVIINYHILHTCY
jgi:hypothetical protein